MKATRIIDDFDGTTEATTHILTFDGRSCEIDLSDTNVDKLYEFLEPYFEQGRPAPGNRHTGSSGRSKAPTRTPKAKPRKPATAVRKTAAVVEIIPGTGTATRPAAIRQWWQDNPDGLPTWQARGAIPAVVFREWEQRGQAAGE